MSCGTFLILLVVIVFVVTVIAVATNAGATKGASSAQPSRRTSPRRPRFDNSIQPTRQGRPARRVSTPEQCWIGRGRAVEVAGYRFSDGMLYIGRDLPPVHENWRTDTEPALIQPHLRVQRSLPDRDGSSIGYWPSYSEISGRARAGYLEWLAGGRRVPNAPIGFVFLFFYGIERRVLSDAQDSGTARAEVDGLLREVEELLTVYGGNQSFQGYAGAFLEIGGLLHRTIPLSELKPPLRSSAWDVPLVTKMVLGVFAQQGEPVTAEWALSWALTAQAVRRRTPVRRCAKVFEELFLLRYPERFRGGGIKIKPNKTLLTATYRPASPSFGHGTIELNLPDLPDVTILSGPLRTLQKLVDEVTDDLDAYSRWVGRKDDRTSPAALALLPAELVAERDTPQGQRFLEIIEDALNGATVAAVDVEAIVKAWPSNNDDKLTKQESAMLAQFLERRGIGIEPDCRLGGPPLGKARQAVVFRFEGTEPEVLADELATSVDYRAAAVLLRLATAVAAADGEISADEERHLREHLERGPELPPSVHRRLAAHLQWLLLEPPGLVGMKRRLEALREDHRRVFARFLVTVAGADGRFDPEEVRVLRKIYPLLGLEADGVFTDIHALMAGDDEDEGPMTVLAAHAAEGHTIPVPDVSTAAEHEVLVLDGATIRATREATERISGMLAEIFDDSEPGESATPIKSPTADSVCGLDPACSAFLLRIAERPRWERAEIEHIADSLGVLPDGVLELINEAALEASGDPLLEGDEVIEIDQEILQEMLR